MSISVGQIWMTRVNQLSRIRNQPLHIRYLYSELDRVSTLFGIYIISIVKNIPIFIPTSKKGGGSQFAGIFILYYYSSRFFQAAIMHLILNQPKFSEET